MEVMGLLAQYLFLMFLLFCIKHRGILIDMTDGNVERLEREDKRYQEALWWLEQMKERRGKYYELLSMGSE